MRLMTHLFPTPSVSFNSHLKIVEYHIGSENICNLIFLSSLLGNESLYGQLWHVSFCVWFCMALCYELEISNGALALIFAHLLREWTGQNGVLLKFDGGKKQSLCFWDKRKQVIGRVRWTSSTGISPCQALLSLSTMGTSRYLKYYKYTFHS